LGAGRCRDHRQFPPIGFSCRIANWRPEAELDDDELALDFTFQFESSESELESVVERDESVLALLAKTSQSAIRQAHQAQRGAIQEEAPKPKAEHG